MYLVRGFRLSPRTYMYLGAVSGLVFGAVEAVHYSDLYATLLSFDSTSLMTEVWRLVSGPVLHACMAGISCYFIGLASTHRNKQIPLIGFGLAIAALLHGAYDTTANSWMGVAITAVIIFIFVGYVLSAEKIADSYRGVANSVPSGPADTVATRTNHSDPVITNQGASGRSTGLFDHNAIEHGGHTHAERWVTASGPDAIRTEEHDQREPAAESFAAASR